MLSQNAAISEWINPELVTRIDSYTREGVTRVSEMRRLLKIAFKKIFKDGTVPDVSNKRFFPREATKRDRMVHSRRSLCHSLIDQECLQNRRIKERKLFNEHVFRSQRHLGFN